MRTILQMNGILNIYLRQDIFHIEIKNALKCQNVNCMFTRGTLELFRNLSLHLPSTRRNRSYNND